MRLIMVTGAAGYVGSVLVRQLLEKGYKVRGIDALLFGDKSLAGVLNNSNYEFIKGDVRNIDFVHKVCEGITDIIHLAAIVGDPACSKQPELAREVNWIAAKNLFDIAIKRKLNQFIFASTCSNYGKMKDYLFVNEDSELNPISLYAQLKVEFENYIMESDIGSEFVPTILRYATVYGLSPRMRFDLTVNEFTRDVFFGKQLDIFGEQFWRPYCHVQDIANACIKVLESAPERIRKNVFNVGSTNENYQKKMIADEILKIVPDASINFIHKDEDPRDYRVNFSKIKKELKFNTTKVVADGIREIYTALSNNLIPEPYSKIYQNI